MSEKTLIEEMIALDDDALARMWSDLNRWDWPRDLSTSHKPYWWSERKDDTHKTIERKHGFAGPLMKYAKARVPDDVIQDAWMQEGRFAESTT